MHIPSESDYCKYRHICHSLGLGGITYDWDLIVLLHRAYKNKQYGACDFIPPIEQYSGQGRQQNPYLIPTYNVSKQTIATQTDISFEHFQNQETIITEKINKLRIDDLECNPEIELKTKKVCIEPIHTISLNSNKVIASTIKEQVQQSENQLRHLSVQLQQIILGEASQFKNQIGITTNNKNERTFDSS